MVRERRSPYALPGRIGNTRWRRYDFCEAKVPNGASCPKSAVKPRISTVFDQYLLDFRTKTYRCSKKLVLVLRKVSTGSEES